MTSNNPEDREEREACALCGERITPATERAFGFGAGNVLCAACAAARGGRFDADRDVWDVAPDLSGLADEAYGAAPHEMRRGRHSSKERT
jgi:hypothetical protein